MDVKSIQELSNTLQKMIDNHINSRVMEIVDGNENVDRMTATVVATYEAIFSLKSCDMFLNEKFGNLNFFKIIGASVKGEASLLDRINAMWAEFIKNRGKDADTEIVDKSE